MNKRIYLGSGVLSWKRSERISDRYGSIFLMGEGTNSFSTKESPIQLINKPEEDTWGKLIVEVTQTRQSTHIGDLFRGIFPTTPKVGDEFILGEGYFFNHKDEFGYDAVGLAPYDEEQKTDWLDPFILYQVHEQSVNLYFEPTLE